ncbi:MAG: nitrate- and nitrite sensing domain-containing protein [Actinomycetota bacterium]
MLRNRGIRTKLIAVLALPVIVLMIGAALLSIESFQQASQAARVEKLTRQGEAFSKLADALNAERTTSLAVVRGDIPDAALPVVRATTNESLAAVNKLVAEAGALQEESNQQATGQLRSSIQDILVSARSTSDNNFATQDEITEKYNDAIDQAILIPRRIGDSLENRTVGRRLSSFAALIDLIQLADQERNLGQNALKELRLSEVDRARFLGLERAQASAVNAFEGTATGADRVALRNTLTKPEVQRDLYEKRRFEIAQGLTNNTDVTMAKEDWDSPVNDRIVDIEGLVTPIIDSIAKEANSQAAQARSRAIITMIASLIGVVAVLVFGLLLARAVTRPLRQLTRTAKDIADELPRMVERMAKPGEGPSVQIPEIPVRSSDEVGQLAQAFQNVNETTVRVAEEQAALRGSIAEMFVNVARRNHVLLSRQLSFIDQLERTEENPDTLENLFRLDHLATRMRRNAESLIVLAGIDAGRRLRRPMPVSDVVRTAVSEIERYDRVDLALQADPPLIGHVALTAAHLIAELLENATQFSNPDTRVVVSTAFSNLGVQITITDQGLGMTREEIREANERIANPPATEVVGSQRLGFYVVGRLARRLDATVELRSGRTQGTIAVINLPRTLFVPGSVAEAPPVASEPQEWAGFPTDGETTPDAGAGSTPAAITATDDPGFPITPSTDGGPGITGLPRRGSGGTSTATPPVVEPRIPLQPAPVDSPSIAEHLAAAADAAQPYAPTSEETPRGGIFSGFRSRRSVAVPVDEPAEIIPRDDLTQDVSPEEVLAPAPEDASAAVDADSYARPVGDAPTELITLPSDLPERVVPENFVTEAVSADARVADPLNDPLPNATPEYSTVEHIVEDDVTFAPETAEPGAVREETKHSWWSSVADAPHDARSELSDFARPDTSAPTVDAVPVASHDAEAPAGVPFPIPTAAASMDVLPDRANARSRLRRRGSKPKTDHPAAAESPVPPAPPTQPISFDPAALAAAAGTYVPSAPPATQADGSTAADATVAATPVASSLSSAASFRQRSVLASEALSELSALSTYSPESTSNQSASLQRRTPLASAAGQMASAEPEDQPIGARRGSRNAADVRSMLSGFQAGVQRGRTVPPSRVSPPGADSTTSGESA